MTVIKVIKHPKYNKLDSSIAMLQLCSSVTFTDYMKPVCLAAGGSVFAAGTESWVTGWGLNEGEERYFKITPNQGSKILEQHDASNDVSTDLYLYFV